MTRALSLVNRQHRQLLVSHLKNTAKNSPNNNNYSSQAPCSLLFWNLNRNKSSFNNSNCSHYSTSVKSSTDLLGGHEDSNLWVNHKNLELVDNPILGLTLPEMVRESFGGWGSATAFECVETGRKLTHDQVLQQSRGFAAALIHAGFKRGDVIGVVLHNIPEYCSVLFGIWDAGLVASPVNPAYTAAEIKRQLDSSGAKGVVTISDYLPAVQEAKVSAPNLTSIIIVGEPEPDCHTYYEMIKTDTKGVEFFKGSQVNTLDEVALLPYSSGTTGPPKGVMLTHSNLATNLVQSTYAGQTNIATFEGGNEQERFIGILPFFHSYGLSTIMTLNMIKGSHTMTLPRFDTKFYLKVMREHKPTFLHLVTPLISYMVNSDDYGPKEFSSIHSVLGAAAPIGPALINQMLEKAGKFILFQEGYGMTELSPGSHVLPVWTNNQKVGSCGAPIPSTMTKIVDVVSGKTLPKSERGEICVKGPQVMKGYYNNEEATRNTIDPDGWLHTGDIGYYDQDDCLYIVDRLKELIKVKGFQVAPSELEDLLRSHDKVSDVAVIGVPNAEWGELPRAYIVKKSKDDSLSEKDINGFLQHQVTSYKQLRGGVEFVKEIPKAPTGKILRRELLLEYKKQRGIE